MMVTQDGRRLDPESGDTSHSGLLLRFCFSRWIRRMMAIVVLVSKRRSDCRRRGP